MARRDILRNLLVVHPRHALLFHKRHSLALAFGKEMQADAQQRHSIASADKNWRAQFQAQGKFCINHETMFDPALLINGILQYSCRENNHRKNAGILDQQEFS